jgi:hypothetical protein
VFDRLEIFDTSHNFFYNSQSLSSLLPRISISTQNNLTPFHPSINFPILEMESISKKYGRAQTIALIINTFICLNFLRDYWRLRPVPSQHYSGKNFPFDFPFHQTGVKISIFEECAKVREKSNIPLLFLMLPI